MHYNKKLRPTVEGGMLAAVSIFFAIAGTVMPVFGAFFNIVWPIPMVILGVRHGLKWSIWSTVISGILIALLVNPVQALMTIVGLGLIGIVFGHAFRHNWGPAKTMFVGTIAALLSTVGMFLIGYAVTGINPLALQTESFQETFKQMADLYRSMGLKEQDIEQIEHVGNLVIELFRVAIPALLVLSSLFSAWFNYVIARMVLLKLGNRIEGFLPFREWLLPKYISYFFLLAIGLTYFGHIKNLELTYTMGLNVLITMGIVLFVGGLSLLVSVAQRFNLPKWVTVVICIVVMINGILSQVVVLLGAMDTLFDYRRLRAKTENLK